MTKLSEVELRLCLARVRFLQEEIDVLYESLGNRQAEHKRIMADLMRGL